MFRCLFFRLLVRSVECTGTRISRVLFGMEERLGRRMLCRMKGMTVFWCMFFVVVGGWLFSRWTYCSVV